jgi:hypothetical protein
MFNDFNNALRNNYGFFTIITFCNLLILFLGNISFSYGFSYNEFIFRDNLYYPSSVFLLWNLFAFFIWSAIRQYRENSNSKWFLVYLIMTILYNPIYRISAHRDIEEFVAVILIVLTLISIADKKYYVQFAKFLIKKMIDFLDKN